MTQFLGFLNYGEEYKMMGLAPYGEPKYFDNNKKSFKFSNKNLFQLNLEYFNHAKPGYRYIAGDNLEIDQIFSSKLNDLFFEEKTSDNNFIKNFACSVQKFTNTIFKKIISQILSKKYSNKIVFSGGCALNSSANKILTENKDYFEDIFINYAQGDNGGAIGSCTCCSNQIF